MSYYTSTYNTCTDTELLDATVFADFLRSQVATNRKTVVVVVAIFALFLIFLFRHRELLLLIFLVMFVVV